MLGHRVAQKMSDTHETYATLRSKVLDSEWPSRPKNLQLVPGIRVEDFRTVNALLERLKPDVAINCIGAVKQLKSADDHVTNIVVNSLFPHQLARSCAALNTRVVTLSTDCVFSGKKGNYNEDDSPDATDLYGRTKLLGELDYEHCLTIRTSMIGHQLHGTYGLVEWFLKQGSTSVNGFKKAIFSGLTTNELANTIAEIVDNFPNLHGIWNVSADAISKYDLLMLIKKIYELPTKILEENQTIIDRSLDSSRFRAVTQITPPSWPDMLENMKVSNNYDYSMSSTKY